MADGFIEEYKKFRVVATNVACIDPLRAELL